MNGDRAKVEGNSIEGFGDITNFTDDGVQMPVTRYFTFRYNRLSGFEYGLWRNLTANRATFLITDNQIENIEQHWISLTAGQRSRIKINDNDFRRCESASSQYSAISFSGSNADASTFGSIEIKDNRMSQVARGAYLANTKPSFRNNLVEATEFGVELNNTSRGSIRDNYIAFGDPGGDTTGTIALRFSGTSNERIAVSGNTTRSFEQFIQIANFSESPVSGVTKNDIDVYGSLYPIEVADTDSSASPIKFSGNYWGSYSSADGTGPTFFDVGFPFVTHCDGSDNATAAKNNGSLQLTRSAKTPPGSRYKGRS